MKKYILMVMLMTISHFSFAQFTSSGGSNADCSSYNRVYASFSSLGFGGSIGKEFDAISGGELGYIRGISISEYIPLFIETGIGFQFNSGSIEENRHGDADLTTCAFNVPVNVTYAIPITDGISVAPYTGFNLKCNVAATEEVEEEKDTYKYDLFDKDDVYETANRVQVGCNFGVGLNCKNLYFGVQYTIDLMEFSEDVNTHTISATLGFKF